MSLSQIVLANDSTDVNITQFDQKHDDSGAKSAVSNIIGTIIDVARTIGVGVAIIMLIVLAIQYISASPEGKAELKKTATIYVVGAVVLFAASGILTIVKRFAIGTIDSNKNET